MDSNHFPIWTYDDKPAYEALEEDYSCDVVIAGGGITGLTAALMLCESGQKVCVIEMNQIGSGTTGASTGHLDNHYDQRIAHLIKNFGEESAKIILNAKREAIDHIENWINKYDMQECDFRRIPAYLYTENEKETDIIESEYNAAMKAGLKCSIEESCPLSFGMKRTLKFEDQARVSPLAYVYGLSKSIIKMGGRIFENTRMQDYDSDNGKITVKTQNGTITADAIVLAGHTSLAGKLTIQPKIYPMFSFVIAAEVEDKIEDALYWDTNIPYFYTRIYCEKKPETILIGGADREIGSESNEKSYEQLKEYAARRYRVKSIKNWWSQEFFEPADGLPYVGRVPGEEKVFTAGAFSGDGLTFGTMSAKIVCDLICKNESPAARILMPGRVKPSVTISKLVDMAGHIAKHFAGDRLDHKGDVSGIPINEGRVIKEKGHLRAIYRDFDGSLHSMSAKCRHMGCIVHWNSAEKTWDCPCHGGRYDRYGNVIAGPPREPLKLNVGLVKGAK